MSMRRTGHFTSTPTDSFIGVPAPCELPPDVDAVLFRSAPVSCAPARIAFESGYVRYAPTPYRRYYIDLSDSFDTYLKHFTSRSRWTLLRKVKKFNALPDAHWRAYRSACELLEFVDVAGGISKNTYQQKVLNAGLPDSQGFREQVIALANARSAIGAILFIGNQPVSYIFCRAEDGILLYEYVGYDPAVRDLSPGIVLQYYLLEELFNNHEFRAFDFTEGEGQHKAFFATHSVLCADVYFFRNSAANIAVVLLHAAVSEGSILAGKIASKLRIKTTIKRFLR